MLSKKALLPAGPSYYGLKMDSSRDSKSQRQRWNLSFQYYSAYFRLERRGGVYDTARGGRAILLFGMWQEHG